jgi:hypothetical protein
MRLWSLHPSYLDAKGLVALWREGLLAQKVLNGKTKGYKNHPQLQRFKEQADPQSSIALYLRMVYDEAKQRGYNFDQGKIQTIRSKVVPIKVTKGQVNFEMGHLCRKLKLRDPHQYKSISNVKKIKAHPLFKLTAGDIAKWEVL